MRTCITLCQRGRVLRQKLLVCIFLANTLVFRREFPRVPLTAGVAPVRPRIPNAQLPDREASDPTLPAITAGHLLALCEYRRSSQSPARIRFVSSILQNHGEPPGPTSCDVDHEIV